MCVLSLGYTSRLKCVVSIMDDDTLSVAEKKEKAKHCMKQPFKLLSTGDPCAGEFFSLQLLHLIMYYLNFCIFYHSHFSDCLIMKGAVSP